MQEYTLLLSGNHICKKFFLMNKKWYQIPKLEKMNKIKTRMTKRYKIKYK